MTHRPPTVHHVAELARVSTATVSRVLRQPDRVRADTRDRVMRAVENLGYVPSANARGLAGRRTSAVGLLLPGHDLETEESVASPHGGVTFVDDRDASSGRHAPNYYFDEVLRGAELAAWQSSLALMVTAGRGTSREMLFGDIAGRVDGLAVVASTVDEELLRGTARYLPVVSVAGTPGDLDSVDVDNAEGMKALTRHVIETMQPGPLLYLAGPATSPDAADRTKGFEAATCGGGHLIHRLRTDFSRTAGFIACRQWLWNSGEIPRAVVAANDQSALGAMDALAEAGISVPRDCLVSGFDGIDAGAFSSPPLTTVRQPMQSLGRRAIELLLRRIDDPSIPPQQEHLAVKILLRESCPPATS